MAFGNEKLVGSRRFNVRSLTLDLSISYMSCRSSDATKSWRELSLPRHDSSGRVRRGADVQSFPGDFAWGEFSVSVHDFAAS